MVAIWVYLIGHNQCIFLTLKNQYFKLNKSLGLKLYPLNEKTLNYHHFEVNAFFALIEDVK